MCVTYSCDSCPLKAKICLKLGLAAFTYLLKYCISRYNDIAVHSAHGAYFLNEGNLLMWVTYSCDSCHLKAKKYLKLGLAAFVYLLKHCIGRYNDIAVHSADEA
jgi:hypothetical protein